MSADAQAIDVPKYSQAQIMFWTFKNLWKLVRAASSDLQSCAEGIPSTCVHHTFATVHTLPPVFT